MSHSTEESLDVRLPAAAEAQPWYLGATSVAMLPWLVRLRWTTAVIEAVVVLVAAVFPHADFPLHRVAVLVALGAVGNTGVGAWLRRGRRVPRAAALCGLALDVFLLTGLLELTGGPFNPFSVVYVAHVTLAALTLGRGAAWTIGAFAVACYAVLFYWHARELVPGHHRLNDFPTHLFTLWIAVAATAELAAYFIAQASNVVARRERELEAMRLRATRSERLVSLTTLAAGAAHELSTPLATIALASRELERAALGAGQSAGALVEDARLIRDEVDRCRAILDQMSGRAGGMAADRPEPVDVHTIVSELSERLPAERATRLHVRMPGALPTLTIPRAGFAQVVLSLLNNAFDASPDDAPVTLAAETPAGRRTLRLTVHDSGKPIAPEVLDRAGEPFYTTKEPGRGLGLGLFLARVFAERCGGSLTLASDNGTTATLELPLGAGAAGTV